MQEIIAIIRPHQWQKTKKSLLESGFTAYTIQRVYGRGRQKGLNYLSKTGRIEEGIRFLPKRMLTLFINDEDSDSVIELLTKNNYTGEIGDGKIFICPLENAERIRTGETGEQTLRRFN
jgi:nitrogen regulatory protein PII 2